MNGLTPLYAACRLYRHSNEIISFLLDRKANPNVEWKGDSCIHKYLSCGKLELEVLKKFKENGCSYFKRKDGKGQNLLHILFEGDRATLEITKYLVEECGVDHRELNSGNYDCLQVMGLCKKESYDIFNYFFDGKLDLKVVSDYFSSETEFLLYKYLDSYSNHFDCRFLRLFVELKANVNPFPEKDKKNLILISTRYTSNLEIFKCLVDLKVNPDVKIIDDFPLKNLCYYRSNCYSIKFFLERTNLDVKDKTLAFKTYLSHTYQVSELDERIFFLFILYGADTNSKFDSWQGAKTASEYAVGKENCTQVIQNFGSNIIWNTKFFSLLPSSLQLEIETLLNCIKIKSQKIPKPLLHLIFNFICLNFHKQKKN